MVVTKKTIQYGQFTTPLKYVGLAGKWLSDYIDSTYTILDSSCGNAVFFALSWSFPHNHFVGADIDSELISYDRCKYSSLGEFYYRNSLLNVSRRSFNISPKSKLCIVGNPPYNDRTSKSRRAIKNNKSTGIDRDIKTRDLGLSFLNSYNKLNADVVLVLHPLSYLIKPTNRKQAAQFFNNYTLKQHIIFSSKEFEGTATNNQFPVLMGLYQQSEQGTKDIANIQFRTEENITFKLSDWSFISSYCTKYPGKKTGSDIWFYSMRDINALKRNRTFVKNPTKSCLEVDKSKLGYYCYCDLFKRFADAPYWMGNFDIPLPKNGLTNEELNACTKISKYMNQDIFGVQPKPDIKSIEIGEYLLNITTTRLSKLGSCLCSDLTLI